jgi:hypothetical protein
MAVGLIPAVAANVWTGVADLTTYVWIQLHIGDPGAAGTANVAIEADRMQLTGSPAWTVSGGLMTNAADVEWEAVAAGEDYTHFSAWTLASGGACGFTGTITALPVTAGDNFRIPAGALDVTLNVAA